MPANLAADGEAITFHLEPAMLLQVAVDALLAIAHRQEIAKRAVPMLFVRLFSDAFFAFAVRDPAKVGAVS